MSYNNNRREFLKKSLIAGTGLISFPQHLPGKLKISSEAKTKAPVAADTFRQANAVFLDQKEIKEIRRKVKEKEWASDLLKRLKESIARDLGKKSYGHINDRVKAEAAQARNIALVYVITGDETYLDKMVDLFRDEFQLNTMDKELDSVPPKELRGFNASHIKSWKTTQWSYGLMRGGYFYAYDLTRNHEIWQSNDLGKRVERRFKEILSTQEPLLRENKLNKNTKAWYAATVAMVGG